MYIKTFMRSVLLPIFFLSPFGLKAAEFEGLTYETYDFGIVITDCDPALSGDLAIPATIAGGKVVGIGGWALSECDLLTSVTIPSGILRIEAGAFAYSHALSRINLPDSVIYIGPNALNNCTALENFTIPPFLEEMGSYVFSESAVKSITIPHGITRIWKRAFAFSQIETIVIPNTVTTIEESAFEGSTLTSITIPSSVNLIQSSAFKSTSLARIVIPDSVIILGSYAFDRCLDLQEVTLSKNMTSIGFNAFERTKINSIVIPPKVISIGKGTFNYCSELKSVTLPEGLVEIGPNAFQQCESLETINLPDSLTSIHKGAFLRCRSLPQIRIPEGITRINRDTFFHCEALTAVSLPSTLREIESSAFQGCCSLEQIVLPDQLTTIGDLAFSECKSLSNLEIPAGVGDMTTSVFNHCLALREIRVRGDMTLFYEDLEPGFIGLPSLKSIEVSPGNVNLATEDEVLYSKDGSTLIHYPAAKVGASYVVPDKVTEVWTGAFESAAGLESITLPEGIAQIGEETFAGCTSLKNLIVPDSVTAIATRAFADCRSLISITVPRKVFQFGRYVFIGCSSLQSILVAAENMALKSEDGVLLTIDGTILLSYPRGKADRFYAIPETVTWVVERAFFGSRHLASLRIPAGMYEISEEAFASSPLLSHVEFAGNRPWLVWSNAFSDVSPGARATVSTFASGYRSTIGGVAISRLKQIRFNEEMLVVEIDPAIGGNPMLWISTDLKVWTLAENTVREGNVFHFPFNSPVLDRGHAYFTVRP